jgi:adenosylcobinamide-GDP ribazoletransferase
VAAALLMLLMVILTGALHLDGFMDTCDGIFYRGAPERRLEIMRDSRVGSFGVVGLATLFLVKYSALLSLPALVPEALATLTSGALSRPAALILMAITPRLAMAYCLFFFPYARSTGLGTLFKGERRSAPLIVNTVFVGMLAYAILGTIGLLSVLGGGISVCLGASYIMSKIPGLTGDSYGALGELSEVVILLVLVFGL